MRLLLSVGEFTTLSSPTCTTILFSNSHILIIGDYRSVARSVIIGIGEKVEPYSVEWAYACVLYKFKTQSVILQANNAELDKKVKELQRTYRSLEVSLS